MSLRGTRRNTINRRRKGVLSVLLPWARRFGVLLAVAVFGVWLGAWLWMTGNAEKAGAYSNTALNELTRSLGFQVVSIMVEGRVYADAESVKKCIEIKPGDPLFAFDPDETRKKIESIDWIKSAHVERRLPDTVYIKLEEHRPLALWQKNKTLRLLNEEGDVIETKRLGRFKELMIVIGEDAPAHTPELIANLQAETELAEHVTSARRVDGRRWDIATKEGVTVKLPETDMGLALRRLADAQKADRILQKDITAIDLREPDRIVIRTRPGALKEYQAQQAAFSTTGDDI